MSGRRGLTVLAGLAAAAVWLLSGSSWPLNTHVGAARPQPVAPLLRLEPVPSVQVQRLTSTRPPEPIAERDPFRFVESRPEAGRSVDDPVDAAVPVATTDLAPSRPAMQLIGLAQDEVGGTTVRTAVITSLDQVYLVREGEQIALRYLVDRIGTGAVQLRDLTDDSTITLALR